MSPSESPSGARPPNLIALVWLPFAFGYCFSLLFRSINAVLSPELVRDVGVNPNELGMLTSAYMVSFAAAQLPLGLLLDRYGPRRVNAFLLLIGAVGSLLFALAVNLAGLTGARALIGLGVSGCLMAAMKAFVIWFPRARLATLNGWMLAAGGLGSFMATLPAEAAIRWSGWRALFLMLALGTMLAAIIVFWVVPEKSERTKPESLSDLLSGLARVGRSGLFWRVGLVSGLGAGSNMALGGLWIAPWMRDIAGFNQQEIAAMLAWSTSVAILGYVGSGMIADWLNRRGIDTLYVFLAGSALSFSMVLLLALGITRGLALILALQSFAGATTLLSYAVLGRHFPAHLAGRFNTAANLMAFAAAFGLQWGIGAIINLWPVVDGRYAAQGYAVAFGMVFGLQLAVWLWSIATGRADRDKGE
jgi:predicted MFS family arabinose efflux permease